MLQIAIGSYTGDASWQGSSDPDRIQDERIHRGGLGFETSPPTRRAKGPPDALPRESPIAQPLAGLSADLRGKSAVSVVRSASDPELRTARDELREVLGVLMRLSDALRREHGDDTRSLGRLRTVAIQPRDRIVEMFLVWVCAGPESASRDGARQLLQSAAKTVAAASEYDEENI